MDTEFKTNRDELLSNGLALSHEKVPKQNTNIPEDEKKNHLTTVEYNTLIKSIKALIYDYQNKLVSGFPAEGHAGPGEVENPDGEVYTIIKEPNAIEASDSSLYTSAKIEKRLIELKTELEGLIGEGTSGPAGKDGIDGKSAYEIWLSLGNVGSEEEYIASLKGPQGPQGPPGKQGPPGEGSGTVVDGDDRYAGKFSWVYNPVLNSLDLKYIG